MWYLMVFANEEHTEIVKVMSFQYIKEIAYVLNETPQTVSNYFHRMIYPRNGFKYVQIFKD